MRLLGKASLSARARKLINKPNRTDAENDEMQRLLMEHMASLRARDERARRWRARRDPIIHRLDTAFGYVICPVVALWNNLMIAVHDGLNALSRRFRRDRDER